MPKVSVIMSVYNTEKFLKEAVDSILTQTFKDFEFIIINDGSTDKTQKIIESYNDNRIIILNNNQNIGASASRNKGLEIARSEYIARMDADDISLPDRLTKQVEFLDKYKNIGYVSNFFFYTREDGSKINIVEVPTTNEEIQKASVNSSFSFNDGSSMFRKTCQKEVGLYRPEFKTFEDYDFGLRFSEKFEMAIIPEPLYKRRIHLNSLSMSRWREGQKLVKLIQDLAKERRNYGKDRLQIPEKRQEVIDYINVLEKREITRRNEADTYFDWSRFYRTLGDRKNTFKFLVKSFILNPFNYRTWLFVGSFFTALLRKIWKRKNIKTV
ncbi:MAG: glycosyltransferase family 2 protein [Planctomycetota bacterium]|nr:glycosyltransferase family 2 protein [Planctomycetota bacterium]MDI6787716.1 glycosyltransferase family 2 protein [Planctomycetota bacterium]